MDMLRFHKFTIGWAWVDDFGSADDPEQFRALHAYSPLHNLKPGTHYPATLITTADHDDRVVPAHSFKFAAALQAAQAGDAPVLIRIETKAGHGAGKPTAKVIEEAADRWAFLVKTLGVDDTVPQARGRPMTRLARAPAPTRLLDEADVRSGRRGGGAIARPRRQARPADHPRRHAAVPVRVVVDHCAAMIGLAKHCFSLVVSKRGLRGLYFDTPEAAYDLAARQSTEVDVKRVSRSYHTVVSI